MSIWRVIWKHEREGDPPTLEFPTPRALVWFLKRNAQRLPWAIADIEELSIRVFADDAEVQAAVDRVFAKHAKSFERLAKS